MQPQNRLRIDDYRQVYDDLDIPITEENCRKGDVESLKKIKLTEKYASKDLNEVAISHCHIISKME